MKVCVTTTVSNDYYQYYVPMFLYCVQKFYPEYHSLIIVRGRLNNPVKEILNKMDTGKITIQDECWEDYPNNKSTTNCLRFLIPNQWVLNFDRVLFTDVDLMFMKNEFWDLSDWHENEMESCFAGHHGPWKKPFRPGISPQGWKGEFERVSGGFFWVNQDWFKRITVHKKGWTEKLKKDDWGHFREADEVMLGRLIKAIGEKIPEPKGFPSQLRGVHIGDAKRGFEHRISNYSTMRAKMSDETAMLWYRQQEEPMWKEIIKLARTRDQIKYALDNIDKHINERRQHFKLLPGYYA